MPQLNLWNVEADAYNAISVPEKSGERYVWKELEAGGVRIVFFPGDWRDQWDQLEERARYSVAVDVDALSAAGEAR
jgi:hypothetical protein